MTMTRRLQGAALGLAFSGILALTACGGDDSSSDTTKAATATTAESGSSDTKATDDTATDDTIGDTTETTFDTSDVDALSPDECRDLYSKLTGLGFDPNSTDTPEDV